MPLIEGRFPKELPPRPGQGVDNGSGGGDDGNMEHRLTALETRLDTILPTLATKADIGDIRADVHKISSDISRWTLATMVTIVGTMVAALIGINQINKPSTVTAQPSQPIVIYAQPAPQISPPIPNPPQEAK